MLIIFFDSRGIVHKEFVPSGSTVNAAFYKEVLLRLKNRVARVRPVLVKNWTLHYDNALAHTSLPLHLCIGQDGGSGASSPSLQPRPVPSGLLLVPAPEKKAEGEAFRLHRGDPQNCDSRIERDSGG
ncbi:uncharacterized protein LOC117173932 [Belonocnema kinseyi]|uniref:uncharacterized protein LOC117173932 n=1 Tax=Belonocnema kinseyi TaxID=2817044 RepID=UPI00143DA7D4|nr:uncharacterized protein LOC117173932 [Belonocnema kinseyi]